MNIKNDWLTIASFIPWVFSAILFGPTIYELYRERWQLVDYGHAYFVLPFSIFLIWLKRNKLRQLANPQNRTFFIPGLIMITASLSLFTFGWRWEYVMIQTLAFIPLTLGLAGFLYGPHVLRPLLFPSGYLLLMVPPPIGVLDSVTLPLRHLASVAAEKVLALLNYPVSREGLLLQLGGHEIFLGAPCSGFRSLITMFALGLIYIYFNKGKPLKNFLLIASIAPLAIVGNVIRVVTICLITFHFGDEAGQGFLHEFSGMVVFLIMLGGLMGLEKILRDRESKS